MKRHHQKQRVTATIQDFALQRLAAGSVAHI